MPFTTDIVVLNKTYNSDFSDFTIENHATTKKYVDYKSGNNSTFIDTKISNLRTEILGVANQSLLTEMERKYDTVKEIADQLIENKVQASTLVNSIENESAQRNSQFLNLSQFATNETIRASQAENELKSQLQAETASRTVSVTTEQKAREDADTLNRNLINSEIENRMNASTVERSQRMLADQENKSSFDTYKSSNDSKFNNLTFDVSNQVYNFASSISLNSTLSQPKYFNLSDNYRTFATETDLSIQFKNPSTNQFQTVFKISV
jgi:hypothetical protein